MTIQTVIDQYTDNGGDTYHDIFFLAESPEIVKASIELNVDVGKYQTINRTVYSLEEYMTMQSRPMSNFCPPAPKKGIWWLTVEDIDCVFSRTALGMSQYEKILMDYTNGQSKVMSKHFHVTLAYDVTKQERPEGRYASKFDGDRKIGEYHPIYVHGLAYNDKCACLVVHGVRECCNKHPHLTLATAEGVPPVYSNDMLAGVDGPYNFLPLDAELEGTLEFK